jgi:hypothetical protein
MSVVTAMVSTPPIRRAGTYIAVAAALALAMGVFID